jgi:uncharacterized membrane protein SirB2
VNIALLKLVHISCAGTSYILFFLRGLWLLHGSSISRKRWTRTVPHMVDSVLLASAIWLALHMDVSPLKNSWLMAKILALLLYIGLGFIAIRFSRNQRMRFIAWIATQAVFFYIVSVALTKNPLPWTTL